MEGTTMREDSDPPTMQGVIALAAIGLLAGGPVLGGLVVRGHGWPGRLTGVAAGLTVAFVGVRALAWLDDRYATS